MLRLYDLFYRTSLLDFHGGLVVKTLCFQCRGCGFHPWLGNQDSTCHEVLTPAPPEKVTQLSKSMPRPVMLKNLKLNGSLKTYKTF